MKIIDNKSITAALQYDQLIEVLREVFQHDFTMPVRHHHFYENAEGMENALILMPAWTDQFMGVKQVIVAKNNTLKNLPAIHALYTLFDAITGQPLVQMDAAELTSRRTACTSALAASYLARTDSSTLLVVGSGKVAQHLVQAHSCVRKYERIILWARNKDKSARLLKELIHQGYGQIEIADHLEDAVRSADVISCATLSEQPLIFGDWIKAGTHLDLIGSHTPRTREVDDRTIIKSKIYVDSRAGALHETGELAIPIQHKILDPNSVCADIVELCKNTHPGRHNDDEITLFKSAGLAIEDLAAALLVYQSVAK